MINKNTVFIISIILVLLGIGLFYTYKPSSKKSLPSSKSINKELPRNSVLITSEIPKVNVSFIHKEFIVKKLEEVDFFGFRSNYVIAPKYERVTANSLVIHLVSEPISPYDIAYKQKLPNGQTDKAYIVMEEADKTTQGINIRIYINPIILSDEQDTNKINRQLSKIILLTIYNLTNPPPAIPDEKRDLKANDFANSYLNLADKSFIDISR
jgi:hypothetical protein